MKSIYQDKEFSDYWNNRVGDDGEDYKRFVLDPLMLSKIGSLKGKTILEMGCGNGYMATKFLRQNPSTVWMLDISQANLDHAREKTHDPRVKFLRHDVTEPWPVDTHSIDVVYSNMVLNEVPTLAAPIQEVYRILKQGGQFIFSVLHPAFLLFFYAQQEAGLDSGKFINLGGYFSHNDCKYIMGTVSITKPAKSMVVTKDFAVEQTQSTLEDYFNEVIGAGLSIKAVFEPMLSNELLKHNPGFRKYSDRPIGLVIHAVKN